MVAAISILGPTSQEIGHVTDLTHMEQRPDIDIRGREVRGREVSRRIHNAVVRSTAPCTTCRGNHWTEECPAFLEADLIRKKELVREHELCSSCLNQDHGFRFCKTKRVCGVDGWTRSHNQDLHEEVKSRVNHQGGILEENTKSGPEKGLHINTWRQGNASVALGVVVVRVKDARGRIVSARALKDEGSDASIASLPFVR